MRAGAGCSSTSFWNAPASRSRRRPSAALIELHAYHQANNLWELVPDGVRPALAALRDARPHARRRVERQRHAPRAHGSDRPLRRTSTSSSTPADEGVEKPDPRLFRIALDRAARAAGVDDSRRRSLSGGCRGRAGGRACGRCCSMKPICVPMPTATASPHLASWSSRVRERCASTSPVRGASPLGLPYTRSRARLRRRAPIAWLARSGSLAPWHVLSGS